MKTLRYLFLLLILCGWTHGNPGLTFTPAWQTLSFGSGGNVQAIHVYADGTTLAHGDTYGGYLYSAAGPCVGANGTTYPTGPCWTQLVTINSLPASAIDPTLLGSNNLAAGELIACPSNTNVLYMIYTGNIYVSINKGATWVLTPATTTLHPNGGPIQNWMACDPSNPDIVYLTTPSNGAYYTINGRSGGTSTWTQVSSIANASGGLGGSVAYDPQSSVVGGVTQRLMISVNGTGVYETTNGGPPSSGSFTLTGSSPTGLVQLECDKFSQFWGVSGFNATVGTAYRYASGSWSNLATGAGVQLTGLAFDPNTGGSSAANHVVVSTPSGGLYATVNNGATWTNASSSSLTFTSTAPQPVWLNVANQAGILDANRIAYDTSGNVLAAAGLGVWKTGNPITAGVIGNTTPYAANTIGIEQLVTNQVISPPGNSPLSDVWDKGVYLFQNPDVYPAVQWTNATSNAYGSVGPIVGGWGLDYASAGGATNFIVTWTISNISAGTAPASSSDGGVTWTLWPTTPGAISFGGAVAASTTTNWITVPGASEPLAFTTNGGTTWANSTATGNNGWINSYAANRQPIAADRVTSGEFYAVDLGTGAGGSQTFWRSTNNGATFTKIGATPFDGSAFSDQLQAVPGNAGHIFYTAGFQNLCTGNFWKSTDQGTTWVKPNSNVTDAGAFGFGATKPGGGGYPMIYIIGCLSSVYGVYASADAGTTWAAINVPSGLRAYPGNAVDLPKWITGDANVYGRIYVGYGGSGGTYIDAADACPWVNFSNTKPTAALTGTVTLTAQHSGLVPVTGVQFSVDGVNIGSSQTGQTTYSVSFNASAQMVGAHTLKVQATGNGCTSSGNSFSIPITTS